MPTTAPPPPSDLVDALGAAERICVLTGAGVSAESGVPTFRDARTGLWARYDPMELATPEAFERDPALVTRWYDGRRTALRACTPNPGHDALARLERAQTDRGRVFTLATQNVDRLHQRAGSRRVLELHGSIWEWWCVACAASYEERGESFGEHPPRCACGGLRRPGVVWFGEVLPTDAIEGAAAAAQACDLFLVIGTSSLVYPAAGLASLAQASGAKVVEINSDATPLTESADWSIRARSGAFLPALVDRAFPD
ncbi:MAG: NAD-dependent deacetylase [Phycisphaerales bacterium]